MPWHNIGAGAELMSDMTDEKADKIKAAAQRAKAEADARRAEQDKHKADTPREVDGRGGLDPVRYDDWEIKGLTSDF